MSETRKLKCSFHIESIDESLAIYHTGDSIPIDKWKSDIDTRINKIYKMEISNTKLVRRIIKNIKSSLTTRKTEYYRKVQNIITSRVCDELKTEIDMEIFSIKFKHIIDL